MLRERLLGVGRRLDAWWATHPAMTRALPTYLVRAISNFMSYGARQAAALSYYAIFSIFPLTLLLTILLSRLITPVFEPVIAAQQIEFGIEPFLPPAAAQTIQLFEDNLTQALEQGASFSLIAILGLIWSGLGLFSNITTSLDFIFHVPSSRSIWRQRLVADQCRVNLFAVGLKYGDFRPALSLRPGAARALGCCVARRDLWRRGVGIGEVGVRLVFDQHRQLSVHLWHAVHRDHFAVLGICDRLSFPVECRVMRSTERMAAGSSLAGRNRTISGRQSDTAYSARKSTGGRLSVMSSRQTGGFRVH